MEKGGGGVCSLDVWLWSLGLQSPMAACLSVAMPGSDLHLETEVLEWGECDSPFPRAACGSQSHVSEWSALLFVRS